MPPEPSRTPNEQSCRAHDLLRESAARSEASTCRSALRDSQEQICGNPCAQDCAAVAQRVDQFVQVLDLQTVVESEAEAVGPVEQGQSAKDEQVQLGNRMPAPRTRSVIGRRLPPSHREA